MKTIIICEGGPQLGMGHVIRMLRLAQAMDERPIFVCRQYELPANSNFGAEFIREQGFLVITTSFDDCQSCVERLQPERLIIDTYDWRGYDFAQLATSATCWLWDDFAPITVTASTQTVQQLCERWTSACLQRLRIVRPGFWPQQAVGEAKVYHGIEWCLLAPEYLQPVALPATRKLLVTFGSSDPVGVTEQVLEVLATVELPTLIVIGPAFARSLASYRQAYPQPWLTFLPPATTLQPYFAQASHVLSAGSTTMYEVLAMKRALATITCVANQAAAATAVAQAGQSTHFGWYNQLSSTQLQQALISFFAQPVHHEGIRKQRSSQEIWQQLQK